MAGQVLVSIVDQVIGVLTSIFHAASKGFHLLRMHITFNFNFKDPKTDEYLERIDDLQASQNIWFTIAMVLGVTLFFTFLFVLIFIFKDPKTDEYLERIDDLLASQNIWFTIAMVLGVTLFFTFLFWYVHQRH